MTLLNKEYMISTLHKLYRTDRWVNELFKAAGIKLDEIETYLDDIFDNNYFDTCSEKQVQNYEIEAAITARRAQTWEDRRAAIRAKWIGTGKVDLTLLQEVVNSWHNDLVTLTFESGRIHAMFNSPVGVPTDLKGLQDALETVKPAHIAIFYTFVYYVWGNWRPVTWGFLYDKTWGDIVQIQEG
ncbi:MAG: DUF2313 domain-containing protein [Acidaminococcaceae bacterium]|nr:DUF2313 domain-containing protein [Acidaminococcaceae bacterium]